MKSFQPFCLPTGIGSLPHDDLENAIELIEEHFNEIPHWPQLPKWGKEEGFINQYIEPLLRLGIMTPQKGADPYFDLQREDWIEKVTRFYEIYLEASAGNAEALEFFAFPQQGGAGFYGFVDYLRKNGLKSAKLIKGQISGPITLGLQLKDQDKRSAYYNPDLRDLLVKTLAMMAKWQTKKLKEFGLPVLMFVDDPGLCSFGVSTYITLTREDIIEDLDFIYDAIFEEKGLTGTHCCAGTDWTILMDTKVNIISFDAYNYFNTLGVYDGELKEFLSRGGILAWGIVPTSEDIWEETVETLKDKLEKQIQYLVQKGFKKDEILKQALITPSCGTGTLSVEMAEKIYTLTNELADSLRK